MVALDVSIQWVVCQSDSDGVDHKKAQRAFHESRQEARYHSRLERDLCPISLLW